MPSGPVMVPIKCRHPRGQEGTHLSSSATCAMTPEVESGWQIRAISLSTRPAEAIVWVVWQYSVVGRNCYWYVVIELLPLLLLSTTAAAVAGGGGMQMQSERVRVSKQEDFGRFWLWIKIFAHEIWRYIPQNHRIHISPIRSSSCHVSTHMLTSAMDPDVGDRQVQLILVPL